MPGSSTKSYIGTLSILLIAMLSLPQILWGQYSDLKGFELADSLIAASRRHQADSLTLALDYAKRAQEVVQNLDDPVRRADARLEFGLISFKLGDHNMALEALSEANLLYNQLGNNRKKGICLRHIGLIYEVFGEFDRADTTFLEALAAFEKEGLENEIAKVISNQGIMAGRRGDYDHSLELFLEAYRRKREAGDEFEAARDLTNIANIYNFMGEREQARIQLRKAMKVFFEKDAQTEIGHCLATLGNVHYYEAQYDSASYYYHQAIRINQRVGARRNLYLNYDNLSSVFLSLDQPDSAFHYLQKALQLSESMGETHLKINNLIKTGYVWEKKGEYEKAMESALKALAVAQQINKHSSLRDAYKALSTIRESQGKFGEALIYYKEFSNYQDSVFNESQFIKLARLKTQMETMDLEMQLKMMAEREKASQTTRVALWFAIVCLAGLLVFALLFFRNRSRRNRDLMNTQQALSEVRIRNAELEKERLRQELKFREKELSNFTLNMVRTNSLFSEVQGSVEKALSGEADAKKELKNLLSLVRNSRRQEKDWENFLKYFGSAHGNFFEKLRKDFPDLSQGELRHCALIKMNLNNNEAADILGVSPNSVKVARYRLRKKMEEAYGKVLEEVVIQA